MNTVHNALVRFTPLPCTSTVVARTVIWESPISFRKNIVPSDTVCQRS
jgi:hypothetical protein